MLAEKHVRRIRSESRWQEGILVAIFGVGVGSSDDALGTSEALKAGRALKLCLKKNSAICSSEWTARDTIKTRGFHRAVLLRFFFSDTRFVDDPHSLLSDSDGWSLVPTSVTLVAHLMHIHLYHSPSSVHTHGSVAEFVMTEQCLSREAASG